MRKFSIILCLIFIIVIMSGCSNQTVTYNNESELNIVTSFYPMYIFTKNITKGVKGVKVVNLTSQQTGCIHDYSLLPQDMKTIENADLLVISGGGIESFMDSIATKMPNLPIVDASKDIDMDDGNAHVWVSIKRAIEQTKNITKKLSEIDSANSTLYKNNSEEFINKLTAQYNKMYDALKPYQGEYIATFNEAFDYFVTDFGMKISAVVEVEHGNEPTPSQLTKTIDIIKKTKTKALFDEPNSTSNAAKTIAKETGLEVYTLNPITSGQDDLDAYFNIMDENLNSLLKGLK